MNTHKEIIKAWPSMRDFAADIGVSENTARAMRFRNSIRGVYWDRVVAGAQKRGIDTVTYEALATARVGNPQVSA